MEFYEIKRGNSDEEQEEDREELMRDLEFEGNPSYYSSSSYNSTNNHQRPYFGASFDVWGEDISRSYHGAAVAATRIQELDLMDSVPPPPPASSRSTDQSYQLVGSSSDAGGDGSSSSFSTMEKEHMFHKVVTPSDVGKLNRLVIPKQHAEKYFPLDDDQMKGLLLNFEDRNGKEWRFRYSYWNSSQSYVMTKGWSRFVKDKKLDAGDVVSFDRGVGESGKDRLFIDWRHRTLPDSSHHMINAPSGIQWGRLVYPMPPSMPIPMLRPDYLYHHYQNHQNQWNGHSSSNYSSGIHDYGAMNLGQLGAAQEMGGMIRTRVINSVPVIHNNAAAAAAAVAPKRLRLFGVNMDCSSSPVQEYSESVVLPSVPLRFATTATELAPSVGVLPLSQSRHYDGSPMPNLPTSDSRGKGYRR
ncbi:hypothetical protein RHSIM_Rhsim01G0181400 [Rhododendron simsii]|uniref:TF-B3 domain-containing protein n=1 Tax=Rhododendron simsii TaxID=118357 RepID=A0A834LXF5_RHOSS|nr:hypothetical protein RHSIM_Rhsim01G0181400 [Rhododendron simsii]